MPHATFLGGGGWCVLVGAIAPLPAKFLLNSFWSKIVLRQKSGFDLDSTQSNESGSDLIFCQGTIFDQKEFKRNLAGRGAYAPTNTYGRWFIMVSSEGLLWYIFPVLLERLVGWIFPGQTFFSRQKSPRPPKNVDRLISEYIDRYTKDLFLTTNLL